MEYAPTTYQHQQSEFSQPDSGLIVPVFQKGDDPIDAINHMMSNLNCCCQSRYPTTNNQARTSSNPHQQAPSYDRKVTVHLFRGDKPLLPVGTTRKYTPGASGSNTGKQRTVICYNCKGEGHISKQCTMPKRKRDETWFNDKVLLVQAQASGQWMILTQPIFALMSNLSRNGSDALTETETEITSDSNIILYFQFLSETQHKRPESNSSAQQEVRIISMSELLKTQVFQKKEPDCHKLSLRHVAVEQHRWSPETFEVKMNQVLSENERLLAQAIDHDIVENHSKKHDNSDYVCINGDDCMSSDNLCVSNSMNDVKFRAKPKKRKSKKEI
ncbi:integrase, catalytic region, zinc finger, CCHC-type containing protein [Tanacetum coccineum]|uniref:Integrase, catalytic region, zinc finger, CCHC-type containing protein n=1 Tax=Tanacetum coccineum TaxID=301880 RepID=A0ABQ5HMH4_9ASTR